MTDDPTILQAENERLREEIKEAVEIIASLMKFEGPSKTLGHANMGIGSATESGRAVLRARSFIQKMEGNNG